MTEKQLIQEEQVNSTLIPLEKYLEAGVHIGSKFKSGNMRRFIYKIRNDGLSVLDVTMLNERIKTAARLLAQYEPEDILVIAGRNYAQKPAKVFAETIGSPYIIKRFVPGTLTNPSNENFVEPKLIFTADPPVDRQAIKEAVKVRIPVLSLCDTSNLTKNIDYILPINNKGKKALALVYWLLTREYLIYHGVIKDASEFTKTIEDFEAQIKERKTDKKSRFGDKKSIRKRRE